MTKKPAKTKIIFLGAGALGRGYLPWKLDCERHDFVYVDSERAIVDRLNAQGSFATYRVNNGSYEKKVVRVAAAYAPDDFDLAAHPDAIACFVAVGPRNVGAAVQCLTARRIPLILCENEPRTVEVAQQVVRHEQVYFSVPDVIASNTAPAALLREDPLALTSEHGDLFVEAGTFGIHGDIAYLSRSELLRLQWQPKLYLHNTPHCVAAYLGAMLGKTYIHEVMEYPRASRVVEGTMREALQMLLRQGEIPSAFLEWYAEKELARFRCPLLHDPVARVARDPLRKLEPQGRLLGAAQMCLELGIAPHHLLRGIAGALWFASTMEAKNAGGGQAGAVEFDALLENVPGLPQSGLLAGILREHGGRILEEFLAMR